jgi:hypothetical protein
MPKRSTFAAERVETAGDEKTKTRRIDKNFDDLSGIATDHDRRLSAVEKQLAGLGTISLSGVINLIVNVEKESREYALMVGYE